MESRDKISFFFQHRVQVLATILILLFIVSCEKDYFPVPPPPKVPKETPTLEAAYTSLEPKALNSKYWKQADFRKIPASSLVNLNTGFLFGDGLLNMTGTYGGKGSFNAGNDPEVTMKAAYDDNKLYILVEWIDSDINAAKEMSVFNGPTDPLKSDNAGNWTSQENSDKVALAFEIEPTSSAAGTFSSVGCAASCHNGEKKPQTGKVDIWNWNIAMSSPNGYTQDMVVRTDSGLLNDFGQKMLVRNKVDVTDPRSAPAFEWDGVTQTIHFPNGYMADLDPGFFLLNKTPYTGDPVIGDASFHTYQCSHCHGEFGEGGEGSAFNNPAFNRKYSRQSIIDYASNGNHTGQTYFAAVPPSKYNDLLAFIRGLSGIPGYYIQSPTESAADIWAVSNVSAARISNNEPHKKYQVLFVRNLLTNNSDDVQFSSPAGKEVIFGLALMDNDSKNHIGSNKETLTFKNKE